MVESSITVVEVGPRDGLQKSEKNVVSSADTLTLIRLLAEAGLRRKPASEHIDIKFGPPEEVP